MPHRLFSNLTSDDALGGIGTGTFVALKLLFFSEATYHFTLVSFDAFLGAAIGLLIYFAYIILRGSFNDEQQRARISSIYNIFAVALLIPLLIILPRMTDSLHPGNGGNPGFKPMDTEHTMRIVFYPACIGWIFLGFWITNLRLRLKNLEQIHQENN